jgi:hypothetical protein
MSEVDDHRDVTLTVDERRTITIPVPAGASVLPDLITAFRSAANDGFEIVAANTRTSGQRDPIVTAVVILLRNTTNRRPLSPIDR